MIIVQNVISLKSVVETMRFSFGNFKMLHRQKQHCSRWAATNSLALSKKGQAMVEFVVAVVLIMLVVGGILTVANLQRADAKSMLAATSEAIDSAMGNSIPDNFSPVKDWNNGPDGYEQTKDDKKISGNLSNVRNSITGVVAPNGDWSAFSRSDGDSVVYDDIKQLDKSGGTSTIGMIEAEASETAEIPPAIQRTLGMASEVNVENQVWMPKTEGLY